MIIQLITNLKEIVNYRNKVFEYKEVIHDNFDTYIKYIVNNVNANKSYLKLSFSRRHKSNIIED